MKAALKGCYIEFVMFMGENDLYPKWFSEELYHRTYTDESRFTFWVPNDERRFDYYEKKLIEDYSVIIRKPDGDIFVTTYEAFTELYQSFIYCEFMNCGVAALRDDCIEYVECKGGLQPLPGYPAWFYEYYTESVNFPSEGETVLFNNSDNISVLSHTIFLRNKFGEIKSMDYNDFLKYYDPEPNRRCIL